MSIENWPALPSEDDWRHDFEDAVMRSDEALSIRLRATAAALHPFAALLKPHHAELPDDRPVFGIDGAVFTVGDLRNARAVLAQLEKEGLA